MSKGEDLAWNAINAFGAIGGNPYMHCPKCGSKCYCQGMEGNDLMLYGAIRKTMFCIPHFGKKVTRLIADNLVHPTYKYYCHKCDYTWKSKEYDG